MNQKGISYFNIAHHTNEWNKFFTNRKRLQKQSKAKSCSYNGTIRINLRLGQQIDCLSLWYLQSFAGFQEVQGICTQGNKGFPQECLGRGAGLGERIEEDTNGKNERIRIHTHFRFLEFGNILSFTSDMKEIQTAFKNPVLLPEVLRHIKTDIIISLLGHRITHIQAPVSKRHLAQSFKFLPFVGRKY